MRIQSLKSRFFVPFRGVTLKEYTRTVKLFDFILKYFAVLTSLLTLLIAFVVVQVDLFFNGAWLSSIPYDASAVFSRHFLTVLYIHNFILFVIILVVIGGLAGLGGHGQK